MKRTLFLLLLLIIIKLGCSQNENYPNFSLGVEGGPTLSLMYGNEYITSYTSPGFSFTGGLSFQYDINDLFSLRICGLFERKVAHSEIDFGNEDYVFTIRGTTYNQHYDYLVIPFFARCNFGEKVKYFINIGPSFHYLLRAQSIAKIPTSFSDSISKRDIIGANRIDIGISLGIGCEINFTRQIGISIEVRDNLGLLPVFTRNYGNIRFNTTSILVGFFYRIKQKI